MRKDRAHLFMIPLQKLVAQGNLGFREFQVYMEV